MFYIPQIQKEPFDLQMHSITGEKIIQTLKLGENFIAVKINDVLKDLKCQVPYGAVVQFIDCQSKEGLDILRHTAAHALAQAVKDLYPEAQLAIGPVIEDGFYYDFYCARPFQKEDLKDIEARMREIVDRDQVIVREILSREEAIAFFGKQNENFKIQIINDLPVDAEIVIYRQGNFTDLCLGPHLRSTGQLGKHFKLTKLSGAYWRGDHTKPQLQRLYGTAWASEQDLRTYITRLEEAERRDHRRLGREMDLFHFQEEAPGSVFWHPKGWTVYQLLQSYIKNEISKQGYLEVHTPQLMCKSLWEASGHFEKFKECMFFLDQDDNTYALKPMNCPGHIQIFNQNLKSYRDLPFRLAEFGRCMRHESSGARSGLMRLWSFVQDDGHIFCTPEQLISETTAFCNLLFSVYRTLGFKDIIVRFSTRPPVRLGDDDVWDHAEEALKQGADAAGLDYTIFPGEGAFYGPKLEFALKDCLGRIWQCGTLQVDFLLPTRLKAFYVGPDGQKHHAVMIHRAILGSLERFIGVLLEHTGGQLPLWLAPVQAVIITISEKVSGYAEKVAALLKDFRIEVDLRNEKIGYKIREHSFKKVPYFIIIGEKEETAETVVLRHKQDQEILSLAAVKERFVEESQRSKQSNLTESKS